MFILLSISSAGVGRTGTFIALDIMLERIPQTHDVNVFECVQTMRMQRVLMVQTLVCSPCVLLLDCILYMVNRSSTYLFMMLWMS